MKANRHLPKPVMTGEIRPNGQVGTVYRIRHTIKADALSPSLPKDKGKVADWTFPWVCGNCTEPKYKSYANC